MARKHQRHKPKSKLTYLPECSLHTALKHYAKEIAEGPYWEPFIDWSDPENPRINWMTKEASLNG